MEARNQRKLGHEDRSDCAVTPDRVRAWGRELRRVHQALRQQIDDIRSDDRPRDELAADLRMFCLGFCAALSRHHTAEDGALFPRIVADHPELGPVVDRLMQDHALLGYLIADLEAVPADAEHAEIQRHLDGIEAIMESHFAYEERQLVAVLDAMTTADTDVGRLLGTD